jgi:hypothetical protein
LHILAVFDAPPEPVADLRGAIGATIAHEVLDPWSPAAEWLALRWQAKAEQVMGSSEFRPDLAHGFNVLPLEASHYLTKMGLEVGSSGTKRGRDGGRQAWAIAADAAAGDAQACALWREWQTATHGRRQLTWSKGLRDLAGIEDVADEVAAARPDDAAAALVLDLPRRAWRAVVRMGLVLALLEAAEGPDGVSAARDLVTLGELPGRPSPDH